MNYGVIALVEWIKINGICVGLTLVVLGFYIFHPNTAIFISIFLQWIKMYVIFVGLSLVVLVFTFYALILLFLYHFVKGL